MGCQEQFVVTDKYMGKLTIRNSYARPSIFLFNDAEYAMLHSHTDWNWVVGNVDIVRVQNKLY